ncbi:MAG: L-arabinose isomerase [Lachnospiraceae bacterium]|nr:L-arabinose isomerase [Lachnospiraceae bacterium]
MKAAKNYKFWFCTGSQDLYGDECLRKVAEHSAKIVEGLNATGKLPFEVVLKPTLIDQASIRKTFNDANNDEDCAGVITWMHTFSPAKMWIIGLQEYKKPLCHLHTQFNQEIPYDSIDMDFMNENQSAHGDREYGHIVSRMGIERKIIVGHWTDEKVVDKLASWMRTAIGVMESSHIRVCRFGDNMNNVAVTEGDKVEAQIKFGWEIDHYNVNDLVEYVDAVAAGDVNALVDEYYSKYKIIDEGRDLDEFKRHVAVQAQIEIGMEKFLEDNNYQAFVTHFGMLGGLKQLPGLAVQRLMEKGYGFGGEGDWKTAAMVRLMKIMAEGTKDAKGTSFMEDYTYNLVPGKEGILQAHMLEVCPSIADGEIGIKVNPLTMGNREDPARLVFTSKTGPAVATSLVDLGNRFRLIINAVDCKKCEKPMPKLPVATAFWTPQPDLATGAEAWILAGGAHHTAFSYDLSVDQMVDWAAAMGIESVVIDNHTTIRDFKNELRWNSIAFK